MDQETKHQFFTICITASLMLLAQTAGGGADSVPRLPGFVRAPPFVDRRFGPKPFKFRNSFPRKDYKDNHWWRMIEGRTHHDTRTRMAATLGKRIFAFRPLFLTILWNGFRRMDGLVMNMINTGGNLFL
jgi:hypothetical protein